MEDLHLHLIIDQTQLGWFSIGLFDSESQQPEKDRAKKRLQAVYQALLDQGVTAPDETTAARTENHDV